MIRPALPSDIASITSIYAHAVREGTASYELEPPREAEMLARFEALAAGGYPYVVAEKAGRVLGYAYAGPFRPRPAYRFVVEDSIYVAPAGQGQGFGRILLERLIVDCTALGFRQMFAVIGDGSPSSVSVRLHASLGFTMSGTLVGSGYKHGRWLDTVIMQLAMNGGKGAAPDADSLPERRFRGA
ncbi:MAG: N-acetyltransferase family protein [Rhizobiaceae bacterium]